jgi:hypothetical protein
MTLEGVFQGHEGEAIDGWLIFVTSFQVFKISILFQCLLAKHIILNLLIATWF